MPETFHFRIYCLGDESKARTALRNLRTICEERISGRFQIEVIDLSGNIQRAVDDDIFATPTVERHLPKPVRRIIGDLSDIQVVVRNFDLLE